MAARENLASLVDDFARHGRQIAIQSPEGFRRRTTTYGELATLSRRFAAELCRRGIVKGDRVLLWGGNSAEWTAIFFGCILRGVLPVPVDLASTHEFVKRVEREVAPKLIAGNQETLAGFETATPLVFFEHFAQAVTSETAGAIKDLNKADALQIVFTSGTTGEPKGIVHTHKNVLASLHPIESEMRKYLKYVRLVHPIRILHTLPLSHVFGQFMGLWIPPLLAAEVHFESRLVPSELVERIHDERISVLAAVPRVLDLMQNFTLGRFPELKNEAGTGRPLKAWQRWWRFRKVHGLFGLKFWAFVCGGASLPSKAERFWNSLGFVVIQGYGMTETTALVTLNHPFRAAEGSVGQVLPGREVRLSEEGEVLVRGETISNATWQNGGMRREGSEWLATGDLAEFDAGGNLRFRGRKKDVIVTSSGLNIYPEDLEAALNQQRGIRLSAVVEGTAEHGPEPIAVLVMNNEADAAVAVEAANANLAEFQKIHRWVVWPEPDFPRTSTGKVLRREIARRIANGEGEGVDLPEAGGDVNLDSLGRVQLQARLEQQYGISIDDTALQRVKTGEDIRQLLKQAPPSAPRKTREAEEHIYPHWPWNPVMQAIRSAFIECVAMPLVRHLATPSTRSAVSEWPVSPMLIVSNHVTSYDVPFILFALPSRVRRRAAVAMSGEMILDWRFARNQGHWFLNIVAPIQYLLVTALFNIFPLPQRSGFRRSFRHAGEAMDHGYNVIVFPEGRRSEDGTAQGFKTGAGLLWKELRTPALPVRLEGLGEIKARGERWFRSHKIRINVGEALPPDTQKSAQELTKILENAVFGESVARSREGQS